MPFQTSRGLLPITRLPGDPSPSMFNLDSSDSQRTYFRDDRTGQILVGADSLGDGSWSSISTKPRGLMDGGEVDMGTPWYASADDKENVTSAMRSHLAERQQEWGGSGLMDRITSGDTDLYMPILMRAGMAYLGGQAFGAGAGASGGGGATGGIDWSQGWDGLGASGGSQGASMPGYYDDILDSIGNEGMDGYDVYSPDAGNWGNAAQAPSDLGAPNYGAGGLGDAPSPYSVSGGMDIPGYGWVSDPSALLKGLPGYASVAKLLTGGGASDAVRKALGLGGSLGSSILGGAGSDPMSAAFSSLPFLLALKEANSQGNDIDGSIDQYRGLIPQYQSFGAGATDAYGNLNGRIQGVESGTSGRYDALLGELEGNQSNFVKASIDPLLQSQATGYGNLTQSLGARGVSGSSFGDQAITNYTTDTNRGIADATSSALQSALGLRSNVIGAADSSAMRGLQMEGANTGASNAANLSALTGQSGLFDSILKAQTQKNTNRNMLLGAGLSASGKLFSPAQDPFGLQALLGGR